MLAGGYAEVVQYQTTSSDIALFDAVGGEEEAFVHSVRPFPFHLIPAYQPVTPWPSTKQKIEKDFILVCEFSEIVGPTALITIPSDGGRNFDKDMFAVKIMAVDYNATNMLRCYSTFTVVEDTSVIIEDEENIHAYVHHFTLYDLHARGYVRPFCMAYITPDKNKLFSYLERLMSKFRSVSQLFRSGNLHLFKKDLDCRLADLVFTKGALCEDVKTGMTSDPTEENQEDVDSGWVDLSERNGTCESTLTANQRFKASLQKIINDCQDILKELQMKMASFSFGDFSRKDHCSFLTKCKTKELPSKPKQCCSKCLPYNSGYHSDSEAKEELKRKTDLKQINAVDSLIFCRDAVVLKLEQVESSLISPAASLLTIGHTVEINFLANVNVQSSSQSLMWQQKRSECSGNFLVETPSSITSESSRQSFPLSYDAEFVPGSSAGSLDSLYYDVEEGEDEFEVGKFHEGEHGSWLEISISSDEVRCSMDSQTSQTLERTPTSSFSDGEFEELSLNRFLGPRSVPLTNGYDRVGLSVPRTSVSSEPVVSRCRKVPVGTGIKSFLHHYGFSIHLIYALLSGRTVVIAASPKHEKEVYRVIKTLRLFVPGHSDNQLIVPWHTKPLTMCDLSRMKLVGLAKTRSLQRIIPSTVFRFTTVFDFESSTLWTPGYKGTFLTETLNQCKHFHSDQSCIAVIEAMMISYAAKAFTFYHTYCLNTLMSHSQKHKSDNHNMQNKLTASVFLAKINVVEGDAKIVQYWVDIIKQQQIAEFLRQSCPPAPVKNPIKLDYEMCNKYHH
ncbi:Guanine nucleotide exchange protein SMCR8 [Holothuria leucospilota]|uniref:Guanine nucleotide exchange protein SMCR8 n=1 Tax=Holothuria leucospilota TaxID=206669 RepID=A0A9Q1BJ70_HOLLE|nr:Guanine nucleotide exchange protein SMCR8 [Holothuria leucospilota]